jgi:hypothetical protein
LAATRLVATLRAGFALRAVTFFAAGLRPTFLAPVFFTTRFADLIATGCLPKVNQRNPKTFQATPKSEAL